MIPTICDVFQLTLTYCHGNTASIADYMTLCKLTTLLTVFVTVAFLQKAAIDCWVTHCEFCQHLRWGVAHKENMQF